MTLAEVLQAHLGGNQQGQLVIKFRDEGHLCKISIENGQALYLTLGLLSPEESLRQIPGKEVEWVNYIQGVPVRKRLAQPINAQLFQLAGTAASAPPPQAASPAPPVSPPPLPPQSNEPPIDLSHIQRTIDRFIDEVGPLGTMLAENIAAKLSCSCAEPMNSGTFEQFIGALAEELPESEREKFISELRPPKKRG